MKAESIRTFLFSIKVLQYIRYHLDASLCLSHTEKGGEIHRRSSSSTSGGTTGASQSLTSRRTSGNSAALTL